MPMCYTVSCIRNESNPFLIIIIVFEDENKKFEFENVCRNQWRI